MKSSKKICIVGAGGLARETALCVEAVYEGTSFDSQSDMCFMLRDEDYYNQKILEKVGNLTGNYYPANKFNTEEGTLFGINASLVTSVDVSSQLLFDVVFFL